jgi:hypothetical protein
VQQQSSSVVTAPDATHPAALRASSIGRSSGSLALRQDGRALRASCDYLLTTATTVLLWRLLFHQPWWLVGVVALSCSLVVASTILHNLRSPEAAVNRAVRRMPWFEVTLLIASLAASVVALLVGESGFVVVALVFAFLALTIHRVRSLLRRRLTR